MQAEEEALTGCPETGLLFPFPGPINRRALISARLAGAEAQQLGRRRQKRKQKREISKCLLILPKALWSCQTQHQASVFPYSGGGRGQAPALILVPSGLSLGPSTRSGAAPPSLL